MQNTLSEDMDKELPTTGTISFLIMQMEVFVSLSRDFIIRFLVQDLRRLIKSGAQPVPIKLASAIIRQLCSLFLFLLL